MVLTSLEKLPGASKEHPLQLELVVLWREVARLSNRAAVVVRGIDAGEGELSPGSPTEKHVVSEKMKVSDRSSKSRNKISDAWREAHSSAS
jgi:hypothetical protein